MEAFSFITKKSTFNASHSKGLQANFSLSSELKVSTGVFWSIGKDS